MTETPISVLEKAAEFGLRLKAVGKDLHVNPGRCCPPEFAQTLKTHKPQLLALLQTKGVTWIEVFSESIGEVVFFCENDQTKASLVEAGAEPWSVYTKRELRQLIAQNRVDPFGADELRKLHEIKRTFNARITE